MVIYGRLLTFVYLLLALFHSSVQVMALTEDNYTNTSTPQNDYGSTSSGQETEETTGATRECPCEFCVSKSAAVTILLLILTTCFVLVILIVRCIVGIWKICSSNEAVDLENHRLSAFGLTDSRRNTRGNMVDEELLRRHLRNSTQEHYNSASPGARASTSSRVSFRQGFLNLDSAVNKGKFAKASEADSVSGDGTVEDSQGLNHERSARTVPIIKVESPRGSNVKFLTDYKPCSAPTEDNRISPKPENHQSPEKPQEHLSEEADPTNDEYQLPSSSLKPESASEAPFFRASSPSPLAIHEPFIIASDSCIASEEQVALTNYTSQVPVYMESTEFSTFPGFMNSTLTESNGNQYQNTSASLAMQQPNLVSTSSTPRPDYRGPDSMQSGHGGTPIQQESQRSEFLSKSEFGDGVTPRRTTIPDRASSHSLRRCNSSEMLVKNLAPCQISVPTRKSFHHLNYFNGPETMV